MIDLHLDLHGLRIRVSCEDERIRSGILEAAALLVRSSPSEPPDLTFTFRAVSDGALPEREQSLLRGTSAFHDFSVYADGQDEWVVVEEKSGARYRLGEDHVEGYVHPDHLENEWVVGHRLFFIPLIDWLRGRGRYPLHGSCFVVGDQGVVVCGPSGVGKSTAVLSAIAAGCPFVSDDTLFLYSDGDRICLDPYPELVKVGRGTVKHFPEWEGRLVPKGRKFLLTEDLIPPPGRVQGVVPEFLFLPEITGKSRTEFVPMSKDEAIVHVLPQSAVPTSRDRMEKHVAALGELVEQVEAFRLLFGTDVRDLPSRIADLIGA